MNGLKRLRRRRGFTLVELLISLVVFGIVIGGAFGMLRSQGRSFRLGFERSSALQNLRYAANVLELDLRTMGANVPDEQPFLIYAGLDVVAINADYTTNVTDDPFAVYYDPDAPTGAVTALTKAQQITLPQTAFAYPDTSYSQPGGSSNSRGETIIFFFALDAMTQRPDDYVLLRQVNNLTPEVVSRDLLQTSGQPFFTYHRVRTPASAPTYVQEVPLASLPLMHSASVHGSPADTAIAAQIDSVRGVQVNFTATNGRTGAAERRWEITRLVRLPNAGLAIKRTCGDEPFLGTALAGKDTTLASGDPAIVLGWAQATDEAGGERDVVRYVLWRRPGGGADWGTPYLSIPAGQPSYSYVDATVTSGDDYEYALAAQDCTPSLSSLATAGPIPVP